MLSFRLRTLIGVGGALTLLIPVAAEAQIVRRMAGGGVQVNAPFVRVNTGPGGTSVRAPFTAVDTPAAGRRFFGRRRRVQAQADYTAQQQAAAQQRQQQRQNPTQAQQPELAPAQADVDALPYPTASQLAAMEDQVLMETLRDMMSRLDQRLTRLKTGEGWRRYLVLGDDDLGEPGTSYKLVRVEAMQKALPRYQSVADDPSFTKISNLPSFVATLAALQEVNTRITASQQQASEPVLGNPNSYVPPEVPTVQPKESSPSDVLPTPEAVELPNATRGERSILKRK